jgi:hypothetical protein
VNLVIARARQSDVDRHGIPKNVRFNLRFELELEPDEEVIVRANQLESHTLFDSPAKQIVAREVMGEIVELTLPSLDLALTVEDTMTNNCKSFAALVTQARIFERSDVVPL